MQQPELGPQGAGMAGSAPLVVDGLVSALGLSPHPEGGFFRETWRSPECIAAAALPARYGADRSIGTAILFLLAAGQVSRLHRLASDELWFFHAGGPLLVHVFPEEGPYRPILLGPDPACHALQGFVPHGSWFGAEPAEGTGYALVGCVVTPGFEFADFGLLTDAAGLAARFPDQRAVIARLG
jgi:predicted cupin superfamily sugar epimerase